MYERGGLLWGHVCAFGTLRVTKPGRRHVYAPTRTPPLLFLPARPIRLRGIFHEFASPGVDAQVRIFCYEIAFPAFFTGFNCGWNHAVDRIPDEPTQEYRLN